MRCFSHIPIILLITFLLGCNSQNSQPTTASSTTPTLPANTATPTVTLTPTLTTSPTHEQIAIQFPEWAKNPETQILLAPVGTRDKGYENMALFNAETGEKFDVPLTSKIGDYFWTPDGSGFGFLPKSEQQIIFFSIKDEIIVTIPIPKEASRFLSQGEDRVESIQITTSIFSSSDFLLLPIWLPLSPDRKYFVYQEKYDETYTSIFDISANKTVYISDPGDEYVDLYSEWSPTFPLLAIVEVDQIPEMYNSFQILPTFRLRVYNVQSQQVIASYKNVTFPTWSPDGTKFLFQEWQKRETGLYEYWASPPCIFDTLKGTTNCYHETLTEEINQFSSLSWSPDQSMISYVYSSQGFCMITLPTAKTQCILAKADIEDNFIRQYSWSPDSNFISFEFDSVGPLSDDNDNPKLGIANVDTGEYFSIGENINMHYLGLWRPSPSP
ncbi:MAG: hypothetical protein HYZ21_06330 [Chloroflexi bacterium]|nr:hypothetical protein [Chloroflexota bacterium]